MSADEGSQQRRILDPIDRSTEAIFGILMVLTFTCTFSAVEASRADVRSMMLAAIGCNLAWGLVDGVMYLVARVTHRMRGLRLLRLVRESDPADADSALANALPPLLAEVLTDSDIEDLRRRVREMPPRIDRAATTTEDFLGAIAIFLISVFSLIPILLPFALMTDAHRAIRVSNWVALAMLFLVGQEWGKLVGLPRWTTGIAMVLGGGVLVAITIALGG